MEILTFLYWDMYIIKIILSIFFGFYLCINAYKMSKVKIQKVFSSYCGIIFGSLLAFLLTKNLVVMIVGSIIGYFAFTLLDKLFKNTGMFLVSFVCIMEWVYIIPTSIIFHNAEKLKNSILIITEKERHYVEEYFMGENYMIWDICFFVAILIGLIVAVIIVLMIKNRRLLNFMITLIGAVQLFGSVFSYPVYFDNNVSDWEVVYIPYMNIHYGYNGIHLMWAIIMAAILFYWIQRKRENSSIKNLKIDKKE